MSERTIADLADDELVRMFPGSVVEPMTDAAQLRECLRCSLYDGVWHPAGPIRLGLDRVGLNDDELVAGALERLGVEVRRCGTSGQRWRFVR